MKNKDSSLFDVDDCLFVFQTLELKQSFDETVAYNTKNINKTLLFYNNPLHVNHLKFINTIHLVGGGGGVNYIISIINSESIGNDNAVATLVHYDEKKLGLHWNQFHNLCKTTNLIETYNPLWLYNKLNCAALAINKLGVCLFSVCLDNFYICCPGETGDYNIVFNDCSRAFSVGGGGGLGRLFEGSGRLIENICLVGKPLCIWILVRLYKSGMAQSGMAAHLSTALYQSIVDDFIVAHNTYLNLFPISVDCSAIKKTANMINKDFATICTMCGDYTMFDHYSICFLIGHIISCCPYYAHYTNWFSDTLLPVLMSS